MALNARAIFALLLVVLSVAYFLEALTLPTPFQQGEPGPAFIPMLLAALLFVSAGVTVLGEMRTDAAATGERINLKTMTLVGLTIAFVGAFEFAGYVIATFAYTLAVAALFEAERGRSTRRIALVSLAVAGGVTLAGWLFFVRLFDLYLPEGILGP